jgi:dUTP pyrophosphatase
MKFKLTRETHEPTKGHVDDAGIDIYIPKDLEWEIHSMWPGCSILIPSGVCVEDMPNGTVLMMANRSSMAKKGLIVGASIIDPGYKGEIHINLWNVSKNIVTIVRGDKIAQLLPLQLFAVNDITITKPHENRGIGAFGSTNKH